MMSILCEIRHWAQLSDCNHLYPVPVVGVSVHPDGKNIVSIGGMTFRIKAGDIVGAIRDTVYIHRDLAKKWIQEWKMKWTKGTPPDAIKWLLWNNGLMYGVLKWDPNRKGYKTPDGRFLVSGTLERIKWWQEIHEPKE